MNHLEVNKLEECICAMVKSRYIGDGHPTFNRNPYNGYINPYYWVDDHPLLYGNNGSLDPGTYVILSGCQVFLLPCKLKELLDAKKLFPQSYLQRFPGRKKYNDLVGTEVVTPLTNKYPGSPKAIE